MKARRLDGPSGRFYSIEGQDYPSVTHILSALSKPALVAWSANLERAMCLEASADLYEDIHDTPQMSRPTYISTLERRLGVVKAHKRASEKATAIGADAHRLIEWSLRKAVGQPVGPEPKVSQEALWSYLAFEDFAREHHVRPRLIEEIVFSREYGYAGTMDLLADVDGVVSLIDFKTSKAIYAEAHLQVAAYMHALIEMGHATPERGYIVRIPKNTDDPEFEVVPVEHWRTLLPTFVSLVNVWKWWYQAEQASRAAWEARKAVAHG